MKEQYKKSIGVFALMFVVAGAVEASIVEGNVSTNVFPGYSTASAVDLVNSGQSSLLSMDVSVAPHGAFPATSLNDGISNSSANNKNVYFNNLPSTVTFTLDTSVNTLGYDITGVNTFAGWNDNKGQFANQKYDLLVSVVGSADFTSIHSLLYNPIADATAFGASWVSLSDDSGLMATGVDAVRFVLQSPGSATVYQEIDVMGFATTAIPEPATLGLIAIFGGSILFLRRLKG